MKYRIAALLCALALSASLLAGCGQAASSASAAAGGTSASGTAADPEAPTERAPVLDMQYADVLNEYHVVGSFCDGVAFAARYLPMTEQDYMTEEGLPRVECGYVALDGTYTPLYTVPNEYALLDPAKNRDALHGSQMTFDRTEEGMCILLDTPVTGRSVPFVAQQKEIDDIFLVGDNGWVPYYENGKWGYCDLTGSVTLAPAYDFVSRFSGGKALVCNYDGALYTWMIIDETGAQLTVFEPGEMFALRKPDSEYVFFYGRGDSRIFRTDGTPVTQGKNLSTQYLEQDGYALQPNAVYNADGVLYEADDLVMVGVQDGCAVYTDGTRCGIRGSDGAVRVEARFGEICRLAPEGFYARENSDQVNLYDYDGNLIEEAPACVRVVESLGGYLLFDGRGALLARYQAQANSVPEYAMSGDTLITEDSFLYLQMSEAERVTLHIAFEDRPVQTPDASQAVLPQTISLAMQTGELVSVLQDSFASSVMGAKQFPFVKWDFDSYSAWDRAAIGSMNLCSEGLEWYETMSHEIVVCDEGMDPVFTVPQDVLTQVRGTPDGDFLPGAPFLSYAGDGLWSLWLDGETDVTALYVFDRAGNVVLQDVREDGLFGVQSAIANEGYFSCSCERDEFYTMTGEPVKIRPAGEQTIGIAGGKGVFDGGLANTGYGYADPQGNVVISADRLLENVRAALQLTDEAVGISACPFNGEEALLFVDVTDREANITYWTVRIDRTGSVTGSEPADTIVSGTELSARGNEIQAQAHNGLNDRWFYLTQAAGGPVRLHTSAGVRVTPPDGVEFSGKVVQWDDRFAFQSGTMSGRNVYIPVDATGKVYTDLAQEWDNIFAAPGGASWGVNIVRSAEGGTASYTLTPFTVSVS